MQLSTVHFPIVLGLLLSAPVLAARAQEVQSPMPTLRPLFGLEWRLPKKYATLEGDRLVIDIPAEAGPSDACATARLPAAMLADAGGFAMAVEAEGRGITPSPKRHLGLKFQLHWRDEATGREGYPNCANETGNFARKTLLNEVDFSGAHPDKVTLMLGLQGVTCRVEFDLSTLRAAPTQGLFRRVNEDWVVRYPDDKCSQMTSVHKSQLNTNHNLNLQFVNHEDLSFVDNQPRRGCMLPGRAKFDYWTIQRLAAEAVREIDPVTPIIVEANHWALPDAFSYLSPLAMDNVIYQVHFYDPHDFTHQGVGGRPIGPKWPDPEKNWTRDRLREILRPVRAFEARHHAKIYVGEFSAAAGADGAENYLRDCMALFNEYGWDWTYHAFREWNWWSVEHEGPDPKHMAPATDDTPRKRALLEGLSE